MSSYQSEKRKLMRHGAKAEKTGRLAHAAKNPSSNRVGGR